MMVSAELDISALVKNDYSSDELEIITGANFLISLHQWTRR